MVKMGRKAKDAAQQKIGEWTGARRNVSKTTTNSENTNTSNENSIPLKTNSQRKPNAMKNCTVVLENIRAQPKAAEVVRKIPAMAKKVPAADVRIKDNKPSEKDNVYDIDMLDADEIPLETGMENAMKDLFDKLARENKIEVKKYRPKNVKNKKTDEKIPTKKPITQKRRREKQPIDVEPPQKKPNLKNKVMGAEIPKNGAISSNVVAANKRNIDTENVANNNHVQKRAAVINPKSGNATAKVTIQLNPRKQVASINTDNVNTQSRLRNRNLDNFQSTPVSSTPVSSTPLGKKAQPKRKECDRLLNSAFFDYESPLTSSIRSTRGNLMKQRLQLSSINDSQNESSTSTAHNQVDENVPPPNNFDDDDFDFGDNVANDLQSDFEVDKENSVHAASISSVAMSSHERIETITSSSVKNTPKPSTSASRSYDEPSTSSAVTPPRRNSNEQSVINLQNESEYNIFSPTKRRDYGRTPLKNITNNINNLNSPSLETIKSVPSMSHSAGMLSRPSFPSNATSMDAEITLPEASYFSSLRVAHDFDRNMNNQNMLDDCFGFDIGDDDDEFDDNPANKQPERVDANKKSNSKTAAEKDALKEIRANLKRFLHNSMPDETLKKARMTEKDVQKTKKQKTPMKKAKTPIKKEKTPAKKAKTPIKHVVFGETGARQKDIRNAFTMKSSGNDKHAKATTSNEDPIKNLFGEVETVQDRRRSYSRPQRHRKRRVSIETDESEEEEEQQHTDDDDFEAGGKTSKRAKRRKKTKTADANPKELQELEEYARKTNEHFDEVDSFVMVVE